MHESIARLDEEFAAMEAALAAGDAAAAREVTGQSLAEAIERIRSVLDRAACEQQG